MLPNRSGSTTALPIPLLVATVLALVFRFGVGAYEKVHPPIASDPVAWYPARALPEDAPLSGRLYLYNFTSEHAGPSKQMNQALATNRDLIGMLRASFVPVRVTDRVHEDGKNSTVVTALLKKYQVHGYPTLVVALPDGTPVKHDSGFRSALATMRFLEDAISRADFSRGTTSMATGKFEPASFYLNKWMDSTRQRDRDMSYAAAYAYVAARHQKKDDAAKEVLDRGLRDVGFKVWPYECMQYLRGDFSAEKLIQIAAGDTDKLTEAEYFIGAKLILDGKSNEARKYLNWVKDNGNKDFLEFKFANWELDNLPDH